MPINFAEAADKLFGRQSPIQITINRVKIYFIIGLRQITWKKRLLDVWKVKFGGLPGLRTLKYGTSQDSCLGSVEKYPLEKKCSENFLVEKMSTAKISFGRKKPIKTIITCFCDFEKNTQLKNIPWQKKKL